jgi:hypothetical protein
MDAAEIPTAGEAPLGCRDGCPYHLGAAPAKERLCLATTFCADNKSAPLPLLHEEMRSPHMAFGGLGILGDLLGSLAIAILILTGDETDPQLTAVLLADHGLDSLF